MRAFDREYHVIHDAPSQPLQGDDGRAVGHVWVGLTACGLAPSDMLRDVDVGPDAFTYNECQDCFE